MVDLCSLIFLLGRDILLEGELVVLVVDLFLGDLDCPPLGHVFLTVLSAIVLRVSGDRFVFSLLEVVVHLLNVFFLLYRQRPLMEAHLEARPLAS